MACGKRDNLSAPVSKELIDVDYKPQSVLLRQRGESAFQFTLTAGFYHE
jgi:hypothetical protein